MATKNIAPLGPRRRSITGVSVMPICGEIWLQPWVSLVVSPEPQRGSFPQLRAGIGVEGVSAVVLGHGVEDVVAMAGDVDVGRVQRFGVDLAIGRQKVHFTEAGGTGSTVTISTTLAVSITSPKVSCFSPTTVRSFTA